MGDGGTGLVCARSWSAKAMDFSSNELQPKPNRFRQREILSGQRIGSQSLVLQHLTEAAGQEPACTILDRMVSRQHWAMWALLSSLALLEPSASSPQPQCTGSAPMLSASREL